MSTNTRTGAGSAYLGLEQEPVRRRARGTRRDLKEPARVPRCHNVITSNHTGFSPAHTLMSHGIKQCQDRLRTGIPDSFHRADLNAPVGK
jgi:hypothetical protein